MYPLSLRPFLFNAVYEWCTSRNESPYIIVNTTHDGVDVPVDFIGDEDDGRIAFDISPKAVRGLSIADENVIFSTRFHGVVHHIVIPINAILMIYSFESQVGINFPYVAPDSENEQDNDSDTHLSDYGNKVPKHPKKDVSWLKVVK